MVTRARLSLQGGDSSEALPGWGHTHLPSLTAGDMRALLRRDRSHSSTRLVYALLLIHADSAGFVFAYVRDIAEAAKLHPESVRKILRDLREAGEIEQVRHGDFRQTSAWRIVGVPERVA